MLLRSLLVVCSIVVAVAVVIVAAAVPYEVVVDQVPDFRYCFSVDG